MYNDGARRNWCVTKAVATGIAKEVDKFSNDYTIGGAVESVEVTYERASQTLTCTSRGGPATSIAWSVNGTLILADGSTYQHSQLIMDTSTATYLNRLTIVSKSATLSGTYACSVGNARGSTTASTVISGI